MSCAENRQPVLPATCHSAELFENGFGPIFSAPVLQIILREEHHRGRASRRTKAQQVRGPMLCRNGVDRDAVWELLERLTEPAPTFNHVGRGRSTVPAHCYGLEYLFLRRPWL